MSWFVEHGNEVFILFLIPIAGLIFDVAIGKKIIFYILGVCVFLLLPIFTIHTYTIPYVYQVLGLIALGCVYSFYSKQIEKSTAKIISAILFSSLLFVILGFNAFINSMAGSKEIENSWTIGHYKIDYVKDQGFAGGALMRYELSKYGSIPLLIKKVDYAIDNDSTNNCVIHFKDIKLDFNKCKTTLTKTKDIQ